MRYRKTRRVKRRRAHKTRRQRGGASEFVAQWREAADSLRSQLGGDLESVRVSDLKKPELSVPQLQGDIDPFVVLSNGGSTTIQDTAESLAAKVMLSDLFGNGKLDSMTFGDIQRTLSLESPTDFFSVLRTLILTESSLHGEPVSADAIKTVGGPFYSIVLYANRSA